MNYRKRLEAENYARKQFERDELRMKELIMKINEYHAAYDGAFLKALETFLANYRPEPVS